MRFHKDGTSPTNGEIFVFGSNLGGIHGAGAAKAARDHYGAKLFIGVGPCGQSYAIPTKSEDITKSLPLPVIKLYVEQFIEYAELCEDHDASSEPGTLVNPSKFWVTAVGCGLAGFEYSDIAPMFRGAPDNCSFPDVWREFLK